MSEILDIVNEHDEVIGQAEREDVHRLGLVCRLVYVCFYTADGQVMLQKRSDTKTNDPGKLTTTASGHVSSGQTYIDAAVRETFEESGIAISAGDLIDMGIIRADYTQGTYQSNAMRKLFAYKFDGSVSDLTVEDGDGAGFMSMSIAELEAGLESQPEKFALILGTDLGKNFVRGIRKLVEGN